MTTLTTDPAWRIETMRGGSGTITHSLIAVAPGCPTERHPTRDCGCRAFRSRAQAQAYVDQMGGTT